MSSRHVRDTFKAAWAGKVPGVTLVDVDNEEPKGMAAPWAALDFSVFANDRDSLGVNACYLEEGEIFVYLFVDSGTGNTDLINHAQSVQDAWLNYEESGGLKIVSILPMAESPESTGLWYQAIVALRYEYRYFA